MTSTMLGILFRHSVLQRRSQMAFWSTTFVWGGLALLMVGDLLFAMITGSWHRFSFIATVAVASFSFVECTALSKVALMLNNPSNAWLVPRARQRAIWTLAGVLALAVVVNAGLFGLTFGNYAKWTALVAMALGGGVILAVGRYEGLIPYLGACFIGMESARFPALDAGVPLVALLAFGLMSMVYAKMQVFPRGQRHWRSTARIEKYQRTNWKWGVMSGFSFFGVDTLYGKLLARDCRQAGQAGSLMWYVLGPRGHWISYAIGMGEIVLALVLLHLCAPLVGLTSKFTLGLMAGVSIPSLIFMQVAHVSQVSTQMHATRTEQGLVRLTPRMPQHKALNRLFVRQAVWQSFVLLLVPIALAIFQVVLNEGDNAAMINTISWISTTVLLASSLLRWITRSSSPSSVWPALVALLQTVALIAVFFLVNAVVALPVPLLALSCLLLAGILLLRDMQRVLHGPAVMPLARG